MAWGSVKWFDSKKGFGFIEGEGFDREVFVHYSGIAGEGYRKLKHGERVEFELAETDKGPQAVKVRVTAAAEREDAPPGSSDP